MNINNTLCPHLTKPISWTDEKDMEKELEKMETEKIKMLNDLFSK